MNSPEFKAELKELVNEPRETGPLKNFSAMLGYCAEHGGQIEGGWRQNYGYVVETEHSLLFPLRICQVARAVRRFKFYLFQ